MVNPKCVCSSETGLWGSSFSWQNQRWLSLRVFRKRSKFLLRWKADLEACWERQATSKHQEHREGLQIRGKDKVYIVSSSCLSKAACFSVLTAINFFSSYRRQIFAASTAGSSAEAYEKKSSKLSHKPTPGNCNTQSRRTTWNLQFTKAFFLEMAPFRINTKLDQLVW